MYLGALVCSSVFVFGSPYTSKVPVTDPAAMPDISVAGAWKLRGSKNTYFTVKMTGGIYRIERMSLSGTGHYVYNGWTSRVGDMLLLNLKDGVRDPDYMIYRLEMDDPDRLVLTSVSELTREQFTTPADLRNFLLSNAQRPGLFDLNDRMVFTRTHALAGT